MLIVAAGALSAARTERAIDAIRRRYLPIIELGPELEARFDRLGRSFQDAVAARDPEMLQATHAALDELRGRIDGVRGVLDATAATALSSALSDYYETAIGVSTRLIAGETGEAILGSETAMQAKQALAKDRLLAAISFDRAELTRAFETVARAEATAGRTYLLTAVGCLGLVIGLSLWLGRGLLRSVASLTSGLERFGRGSFDLPIPVMGHDELQRVAVEANQMAASLRTFTRERDNADWLKGALVGLAEEIRGELAPAEVASRTLRFLTRYLGMPSGALYAVTQAGVLELLATHASAGAATPGQAPPRFRFGEGLVGQAALSDDLTIVTDAPAGYLRVRSALGESTPRAILLLPLLHVGQVKGVLELASFIDLPPRSLEALLSVREMLGIALEVARARDDLRDLLAESQRQRGQLEENNAALHEARRGLEKKAVELTTISSYKSQFLTNMSHELRTPLNSMLLLSNLLAENAGGNLTGKQVEFARTIHVAGQDLLALINQVLDLSRIEAGKEDVRIGAVSLRRLAATLKLVFEPLAHDKGLDLRVALDSGLPEMIETDARRLEQILKNLLGNAIKFTQQGHVTLRIGRPTPGANLPGQDLRPDSTIAFSVVDTGVGIAPEDQERIFTPFEQVGSAQDNRFGGTGLGLGISRELAALLGGALQLVSEPGRGSTFTCYLPTARVGAAEHRLTAAAPAPTMAIATREHEQAPGRPYLLIVEDDPVFAEVLEEIVRARGLACLTTTDGRSALRLARERRPVGIVLDVKLPDIDGWRVMEDLRAHPATATVPVHFVSALNSPERGLAIGAVGFLTKPATREDLRRVVDGLISRRASQGTGVLVIEAPGSGDHSIQAHLAAEGIEVRGATSGRDAVAAIERDHYSCVVVDLSLPEVAGLGFLREARALHGREMPSVVVCANRPLEEEELVELEAVGGSLVPSDGASRERLLNEVRRFVQGVSEAPNPRPAAASSPAPSLGGRTVLVVDDDMRTVYAISALLRGKGADVVVADTGLAAIEALERRPDVHVVLMDMMMPEMDGYEAMRRIRLDQRFARVPIVALTAHVMKDDAKKCLAAGATYYLPKPVDADQLFNLLSRGTAPS
jgi:hypothetical protein